MLPRKLGLLLAVLTLWLGGTGTAVAGPSCAAWKVSGTWTVRQSNTGPAVVFRFRQSGERVTGTARVGPLSNNFYGTLVGAVAKNHLVFVVTWNRRASDGRVLKGHYAGTVAARLIQGTTYALTGVRDVASWAAVGRAAC